MLRLLLVQDDEIGPIKAIVVMIMIMVQGISEWPRWRTEDAGDVGLGAAAAAQRAWRSWAPELLVMASITCLAKVHGGSEHV